MSFLWILLLALSLSFDTFAVSVSSGIVFKQIIFKQAIRFSLIMAFFQGLMPLFGWVAGKELQKYIETFDHWVASGLLFIIAARMIHGAFSEKTNSSYNPLKISTQLTLALATSIDALVVGFTFAMMDMNIWLTVILVGAVTFLAAMVGLLIGKKTAGKSGKHLEILGAIILMVIGIKILFMHLA